MLCRRCGRAQIGRSAADAAERLVAVEARERTSEARSVAGAGDAGAGRVGRRPFDGFGDAEMEKVRIGMTDSTFFICREVEVRIRSE